MKNFSLRAKIILILLPLIVLGLVLGTSLLFQYHQDKTDAKSLIASAHSQIGLSELIHEFQRERGMSILFVNKKISQDELMGQQKKVDEIITNFKTSVEPITFSNKENEVSKILNLIEATRSEVRSSTPAVPSILKAFAGTLHEAILLQIKLFENTQFKGFEARFTSLAIFEESKENMGRLRASLNGVFAGNLKKDISDRDLYLKYLSGIIINLESPGLIISSEGKKKVFEILSSSEWASVLNDFKIFSEKYLEGDYGVDAKTFFNNITNRIDAVYAIVKSEQELNLNALNNAASETQWKFNVLILILLIVFIGFTVSTYSVLNKITKQFRTIGLSLNDSASEVNSAAGQIASASDELSSSASSQASALEETSSSIEEISSMVESNSEKSKTSAEASAKSLQSAEEGKVIIGRMVKAINEINESNGLIMNQISMTNKEVESIGKIINEIGQKTKVINDIVFQTKLLSFNASVEAARAGSHGQGFAVVAEEVGNLASLSGSAAEEISSILDVSIKTVNEIVQNSNSKISVLIASNTEKVNAGIKVTRECENVLNQIYQSVESVSSMVTDISVASREQSQGVREITKAVLLIDEITQKNSASSKETANAAGSLESQSKQLSSLVKVPW